MSFCRTTVSAVVVLLLFTCDLTWAKTGGGGGGYYGGYGSYGDSSDYSDYSDYSKGGKGGPKSCKSNDKYSDIPCHEFEGTSHIVFALSSCTVPPYIGFRLLLEY